MYHIYATLTQDKGTKFSDFNSHSLHQRMKESVGTTAVMLKVGVGTPFKENHFMRFIET